MRTLLVCLLLAGLFFAASSAGSWYLMKSQAPLPTEHKAAAKGPAPRAEATPALRPISAEEVFRFGAMLRSEQQALKDREEELAKRQQRLKLVSDDIRLEQQELQGLHAQIDKALRDGEGMLGNITQQREDLQKEKVEAGKELEKLKKVQGERKESELTNVKEVAGWFQSMPPEKAADYVRQLSNDGKLASAVQLLGQMEPRYAAKILAAMNDAALVTQLTEQFKSSNRPEKKQKSRR